MFAASEYDETIVESVVARLVRSISLVGILSRVGMDDGIEAKSPRWGRNVPDFKETGGVTTSHRRERIE